MMTPRATAARLNEILDMSEVDRDTFIVLLCESVEDIERRAALLFAILESWGSAWSCRRCGAKTCFKCKSKAHSGPCRQEDHPPREECPRCGVAAKHLDLSPRRWPGVFCVCGTYWEPAAAVKQG